MSAASGWYVVNVRDAEWLTSETDGPLQPSGAECTFEGDQFNVRLHVLEPGEPNGLYHQESAQEDFLVLSGECRLLVEGEERLMRRWDFFHAPPGTEHIFVGAGDGPCVILMVGARPGAHDPVSRLGGRSALRRQRRPRADGSARRVRRPLRAVAACAPVLLDRLPWA
jgi:quercetin dioxygenase-like cupin family protein